MRRHCEPCDSDYTHNEVTATGNDETGARRHFIACSFRCLVRLLHVNGMDASAAAVPAATPSI